jgi:hypothetical protein
MEQPISAARMICRLDRSFGPAAAADLLNRFALHAAPRGRAPGPLGPAGVGDRDPAVAAVLAGRRRSQSRVSQRADRLPRTRGVYASCGEEIADAERADPVQQHHQFERVTGQVAGGQGGVSVT